uniref:Uncharacterized protein n=1 Tax=Setaria viridis TaxID=4556 RepID=A0A4U6VI38_SETVI|nr:hypothetical protein SEVIR_3G314406v2 [Setaria viridis]
MHELKCFLMFVFGFVQSTCLCNLHTPTFKGYSYMIYKNKIVETNPDIAQ